jgi:glycosyltransferase involved in cell wall biosynthesis
MVVFAIRIWWLGLKLPILVPEIGKPDVIIGYSPHLFTPLAAYWVAQCYQVPFVMEVGDLWPQTIVEMGKLSGRHPIVKALQRLENFLYYRAERVIVHGPQMVDYISACAIRRDNIICIPSGVDLSRFDSTSIFQMSHKGFHVMYLGAHGQANALDVLIKGAKIVQNQGYRDIHFVLIGDGPESRTLRALARRLSIEDRVEFVGRVPHIRALQYIAAADVFSLPSWSEGFGIVYLEAMACGKPVIACRGEGPEDFVQHGKTGLLVKPRDVDSLVEALDFLLSNPEEAWAMGERARKVVLENYTWEKNVEKIVKLYKELLKA